MFLYHAMIGSVSYHQHTSVSKPIKPTKNTNEGVSFLVVEKKLV